jgi:hypothetical protein
MKHRDCTEHLIGYPEHRRFGTAEQHKEWLENKGKKMNKLSNKVIHDIWLHVNGRAEGLMEAGKDADVPVMFANALLEYVSNQALIDATK